MQYINYPSTNSVLVKYKSGVPLRYAGKAPTRLDARKPSLLAKYAALFFNATTSRLRPA